jgi:regulation of enolase protein 1 (concanavalin A-like superfamily)
MTMNKRMYIMILVIMLLPGGMRVINAQSTITGEMMKNIPVKDFKITTIGDPEPQGNVSTAGNGFVITSGGADIWGMKDEFTFVYFEHTGDFDIAARIAGLTPANLYTKAGLMARADLTADCRHIFFQVFPDNRARNHNNGGYEFQYRQLKGGEMKAIYPASAEGAPAFPVSYPNTWIRLQRTGDAFTGYYSTDGLNWKTYTSFRLDLPLKVWLGLAVTSHNTTETTTAEFRDIVKINH